MMRYLKKSANSAIISKGLRYPRHHKEIRDLLKDEQQGYCAYTEKYIGERDYPREVEHFDDRKKGTQDDNYWNWYAVNAWINRKKPPIKAFLPILEPFADDLQSRIQYTNGEFVETDLSDIEAHNLIEFLRLNDTGLSTQRQDHINRIKEYRKDMFPNNDEGFIEFMHRDPKHLSYITALEAELELTLT